MPRIEVPVTPAVLSWAIQQSGYSEQEVAARLDISLSQLRDWESEKVKPTLTQARRLAAFLHRTLAFFLLPRPPETAPPQVEFRALPGAPARDSLNPVERRYLRRALRLQRLLAWMSAELAWDRPSLPTLTLDDDPESAADRLRTRLDVPARVQLKWPSSAAAFDEWRRRVESLGVFVFLYPMGRDACRGFSVWEERAPLVAVNTAWSEEARIFTLFHELGHLLTRTNSACLESSSRRPSRQDAWDSAERWCERFGAAVLLPADELRAQFAARQAGQTATVDTVRWLSGRFKTSLRATTIRLIELRLATWELYDALPRAADVKRTGGGGGGRARLEVREDQLGRRAIGLFRLAVNADVLSRAQALSYLDLTDTDFDRLSATEQTWNG